MGSLALPASGLCFGRPLKVVSVRKRKLLHVTIKPGEPATLPDDVHHFFELATALRSRNGRNQNMAADGAPFRLLHSVHQLYSASPLSVIRSVPRTGFPMPKGFHTQCLCVLLKKPVSLAQLLGCLGNYEITAQNESFDNWAICGPACAIPFRPEINGMVIVDIVARPWPDDLGHPETSPKIFGPWALGAFGPAAFPGCMQRAAAYSFQLPEAETFARKHKAFIRARVGYSIGTHGDEPVIPEDCDPVAELRFLTHLIRRVLRLPEALCYFNPSGELMRGAEFIQETLQLAREHDVPPLDLWSNIRCFDLESGWTMADMVGNYQLDLPDLEAYFPREYYDQEDVTQLLPNVVLHLLGGAVMNEGDTCDGPGDVNWKVGFHGSLSDPDRQVMALSPCDKRPRPQMLHDR
jgi:hypothetical protein